MIECRCLIKRVSPISGPLTGPLPGCLQVTQRRGALNTIRAIHVFCSCFPVMAVELANSFPFTHENWRGRTRHACVQSQVPRRPSMSMYHFHKKHVQKYIWLPSFCFGLMCPAVAYSQAVAGPSLLAPTAAAFASGTQFSSIQLQGTATFHAGSLIDQGAIALSVQSSGQTSMRFEGQTAGVRTESQDSIAPGMQCAWAGPNGVSQIVPPENCRKPFAWFLPASSIGLVSSFPNVTVTDLSISPVGNVSGHHFRIAWSTPSQNSRLQQPRTTDLGVDPTTSLPIALEYHLLSDGPVTVPTSMTIDIQYGDYRVVNGLSIPFSIQRYVNGSLQYDIQITSANIA